MTRRAIVNIFSSYNNILMTATDLTGAETIGTCSGGQVVKSSKDSGGQFAATRAAERLADMLKDKEFTQLIVKYRAPGGNKSNNTGPGAQAAIPSTDTCRYDHHSNRGCYTNRSRRHQEKRWTTWTTCLIWRNEYEGKRC